MSDYLFSRPSLHPEGGRVTPYGAAQPVSTFPTSPSSPRRDRARARAGGAVVSSVTSSAHVSKPTLAFPHVASESLFSAYSLDQHRVTPFTVRRPVADFPSSPTRTRRLRKLAHSASAPILVPIKDTPAAPPIVARHVPSDALFSIPSRHGGIGDRVTPFVVSQPVSTFPSSPTRTKRIRQLNEFSKAFGSNDGPSRVAVDLHKSDGPGRPLPHLNSGRIPSDALFSRYSVRRGEGHRTPFRVADPVASYPDHPQHGGMTPDKAALCVPEERTGALPAGRRGRATGGAPGRTVVFAVAAPIPGHSSHAQASTVMF